MKKTTSRLASLSVAVALGLGLSVGAHAASTWTFTGTGGYDANGEPLATTSYANNGVASLNISGAYAVNGTNNNGVAADSYWQTSAPDADLLYWSGNGLAMCSDGGSGTPSCSQPNHALDNNGNTEAVLLSFSSSVMLTTVNLGYVYGDADISLFRYTGSGNPASMSSTGTSLAAMTSAGWSLVGNYGNLAQNTNNLVNNALSNGNPNLASDAGADSVGSSWWLISAYNSAYGTTSSNGGALGEGNDYFKIYSVAGASCATGQSCGGGGGKVPEPGSLALASLALMGVYFSRRKPR